MSKSTHEKTPKAENMLLQIIPAPSNLMAVIKNDDRSLSFFPLITLGLFEDYDVEGDKFYYIDGFLEGIGIDLASDMKGFEYFEYSKPRQKLPKRHESLKRKGRKIGHEEV